MDIETDLGRIRALARKREQENYAFRRRLKCFDISERRLDRLVREQYAYVSGKIDCLDCGNCCREMTPTLSCADSRRLARALGISAGQFERDYLVPAEADPGRFLFRDKPCPLLRGNRCSQYDSRPRVCAGFPFLTKPGFLGRTLMVIWNYEYCPIVFNVVERLKGEISFIEQQRRLHEFL